MKFIMALALAAATVSPTTAPTTVSVLAWNVNLATKITTGAVDNQADRRQPVVREIIAENDADVVVISEAFHETLVPKLLDELAAKYPYHSDNVGRTCSAGGYRDGSGWDATDGNCSSSPVVVRGGVQVLSKYPIDRAYQLVYRNSHANTWDYLSNKGAALVRITKDGQHFWVAGTHLQADQTSGSWPKTGAPVAETQQVRYAQLGELRSWVDQKVGADGPVLFDGDLNIEYFAGQVGRQPGDSEVDRATAAVHGVLRTAPADSAYRTFDCSVNAWCRHNASYQQYPVDYRDDLDYLGYLEGVNRPVPSRFDQVRVVLNPQQGWQPGQLDTRAPSDHYPVRTTATIG
ncbi:sphingomyelin phosphodiesterase [Kutzneria albida]|uniref:Endonuclease/exonuclease/phosphatase domain-containing protein n=1 Tax=Kutzneria albida DSM 43870 TaxID=1449976 RepID=W5W3R2_9PSEU|nr:sphingomyelin phosphodiesterase [Kutzneria albida]AHH95106.1 hypothetical protein KALB_1735 [Kutzneria albida DSM 43870]